MTLDTWKREFYWVDADTVSSRSWAECVEHSIRKWEGLRPEALARHGLVKDGKAIFDPTSHIDLWISGTTCALCQKDLSTDGHRFCETCPLYAALGEARCDELSDEDADDDSPYGIWCDTGDPEPMIAALNKALEYCNDV